MDVFFSSSELSEGGYEGHTAVKGKEWYVEGGKVAREWRTDCILEKGSYADKKKLTTPYSRNRGLWSKRDKDGFGTILVCLVCPLHYLIPYSCCL